MGRVSTASIVVCLTIFLLGVSSDGTLVDERNLQVKDADDFLEYICNSGHSNLPSYLCDPFTTTLATTTTTTTRPVEIDDGVGQINSTTETTTQWSSSETSSATTVSGSPLQHAHWCKFNNGSYLSLYQKFLYKECALCQCTESHLILCTNLTCMATYCIDGTSPVKGEGQCCKQCAYEKPANSCIVDGYTFPHGTVIGRSNTNIQCWCQLGSVECRKGATSLLSGLDYWGQGTAVYVIVIVICVFLILGTLLCCGGGLFFYHYYYKNQQSVQDAYAQYYSNAGWQPMSEDGQVFADGVAEEKKVEAEQQQYEHQYPTGQSEQYIPPPYALYNGSHTNSSNENEQKFA